MADSVLTDARALPQSRTEQAALRQVLVRRVEDSITVRRNLLASDLLDRVATATQVVIAAARRRSTVFFFGNGGSATDAGHLCAELLGRFYRDREPLAAIALADNTAAMTAIGNDYGYDDVFARQLAGLAKAGDVAIGLSTSGNSGNVVRAFDVTRQLGLTSIAFTGATGGRLAKVADHCLTVPSTDTPRIQECHMLLGHTMCELVEHQLFPMQ
jgi:D-sedoheptulose 7-phosphate isomerase